MRPLIAIFALFGLLHAQDYWVRWNGELTTPDQREFALKCYEFGEQYNRGHSLAAIAWMESSLGKDTNHNEESSGTFGISDKSRARYRLREQNIRQHVQNQLARHPFSASTAFEFDAFLALQIFEDNIRYFRRLGYSPGAAWWHAAARYVAGKYWDGEAGQEYARKFNMRVKALKEIFK